MKSINDIDIEIDININGINKVIERFIKLKKYNYVNYIIIRYKSKLKHKDVLDYYKIRSNKKKLTINGLKRFVKCLQHNNRPSTIFIPKPRRLNINSYSYSKKYVGCQTVQKPIGLAFAIGTSNDTTGVLNGKN